MNIHEIIHAFETDTLPTELDALAAMESKLDDYRLAAEKGFQETKMVTIAHMYASQKILLDSIFDKVQRLINKAIDKKGGEQP